MAFTLFGRKSEQEIADQTHAQHAKTALENVTSAVMLVDRDLVCTYCNDASKQLFEENLEHFRKAYPTFDHSKMVGTCIDMFHKNPAHQRAMLSDTRNLPHRTRITVGPLTFALKVTASYNAAGEYDGNVLEWSNVSKQLENERQNIDLRGYLDAINRAQAVIEFTLDGKVIQANENFLGAMGYRLEEIQGQHHSMFVEAGYTQTIEYRQFWERLARGEVDSGEYKRIAKGGREIWLQASYNPILDENKKPTKVVKYATVVTDAKLRTADFEGQLAAIGKSQAVIEFTPDGKILNANENFLSAVGYALEEVRGQHHGIFVDPGFRQTAEYKMFWERLARGEYEASEYKRVAKGGREIWLQASYNPILDMNGKTFKVVKYATLITEAKLRNADFEGQIAAIGKAQAVIEFSTDGKILHANENFLKVLGYSQDEVRGQHHSMFVEPTYRQSTEYRLFWEKLGRGEYDAAQYMRIAKGGRQVWIQASYNPILDMNGKPFKVVKYATDVTAQVIAAQVL